MRSASEYIKSPLALWLEYIKSKCHSVALYGTPRDQFTVFFHATETKHVVENLHQTTCQVHTPVINGNIHVGWMLQTFQHMNIDCH